MQARHKDRETYFRESEISCEKYYIPYIREFIDMELNENYSVMEIGCSMGGNLSVFACSGCKVAGVEPYSVFLDLAKEYFEKRNLKATFINTDIFDYHNTETKFDLLILHDVLEHIPEKEALLRHLKKFMKDDGVLYVGFPAWQMPFGGHQQMAKNKMLANFPYIHLLPRRLLKFILQSFGEPDTLLKELFSIRDCRISIEGFNRLIAKTGYRIVNKRLYFINPHYEVKFGLKPRILHPLIAKIPYLRNFFTTTCYCLLRK
ncbi:MAG: methyltransferase domain-containing protein [Cytophagaceae bacterium]|jgi:SAM-dependent methyltransferase|nr:methyltransferase domain-containing protein [Cytophagaceae bacterium]